MRKRLFRIESTHELGAESNPRKSPSAAKHWHPTACALRRFRGLNGKPQMLQNFRNRLSSWMAAMILSVPGFQCVASVFSTT
jgi:hypothetical protein